MAYCDQAAVANACGGATALAQVADFDGDGAADAGVVTAAIAEADRLIDTYASKRYAVPMNVGTGSYIPSLSAKIAARVLRRWKRMVLESDVDDEKSDTTWLEGLRDGKNTPGIDPLPAKSSMVTDKAGERDSIKATSREKLKGYW